VRPTATTATREGGEALDTLNTILSVPAIVAIVTALKSLGVTGKWSLVAALVVAVALNVAAYAFGTSGWYEAVVAGLLSGLAAAGVYDAAKTAAPKSE